MAPTSQPNGEYPSILQDLSAVLTDVCTCLETQTPLALGDALKNLQDSCSVLCPKLNISSSSCKPFVRSQGFCVFIRELSQ